MELKQIKYFLEIVKAGSFSRAAGNLGLTQPALSRQVALLEREFQAKLLDRQARKLGLTPVGEQFFVYARKFDELYLEMQDQLFKTEPDQLTGEFQISTGGTIAACVLPAIIRELHKEFPEMQLRIKEGDALDTRAALLSGEVDLAIISELGIEKNVNRIPFFIDRIVPVVAETHSLSKLKKPRTKDLVNESFIVFHPSSAIQRAIAPQFKQKKLGFKPNILMELRSLESAIGFISAGLGIGFLTESSLKPGLQALDLPELTAKRNYYLAHRKHHKHGLPLLISKIIEHRNVNDNHT